MGKFYHSGTTFKFLYYSIIRGDAPPPPPPSALTQSGHPPSDDEGRLRLVAAGP